MQFNCATVCKGVEPSTCQIGFTFFYTAEASLSFFYCRKSVLTELYTSFFFFVVALVWEGPCLSDFEVVDSFGQKDIPQQDRQIFLKVHTSCLSIFIFYLAFKHQMPTHTSQ